MTLQVACEGFVISNSVIFEYKKPPSDENKVKEVNTKVQCYIYSYFFLRFKVLTISIIKEVKHAL